jgi:hypothetical protein
MSLLNAEVYDAFRAVGANEPLARAAAASVTESHHIESIIARQDRLEDRMNKIEQDVATSKWALAAIFALLLIILAKLFLG